jgi:DNA-binding NarL/FixJ family response regulator
LDGLSPRELGVAHAVADGATNAEIAARLSLPVRAVEAHVANIYRKLDVRSRVEVGRQVTASATQSGTPSPTEEAPPGPQE